MNKNYAAGRRTEYECQRRWEAQGYSTTRASGSHSAFDVIAYRTDRPSEMIQCKRVSAKATAQLLLHRFKQEPPLAPSHFFHQVLEVRVKGNKKVLSVTI